jgi:hypothetical protein
MVSDGPGFGQHNLTRVHLVSFYRKVYRLGGAERPGPLWEVLNLAWPCPIMTPAGQLRSPDELAHQRECHAKRFQSRAPAGRRGFFTQLAAGDYLQYVGAVFDKVSKQPGRHRPWKPKSCCGTLAAAIFFTQPTSLDGV